MNSVIYCSHVRYDSALNDDVREPGLRDYALQLGQMVLPPDQVKTHRRQQRCYGNDEINAPRQKVCRIEWAGSEENGERSAGFPIPHHRHPGPDQPYALLKDAQLQQNVPVPFPLRYDGAQTLERLRISLVS